MRRVLLGLITLSCACGGEDEPLPTGPIAATVTHYDYRFDVDSRAAHSTVTATVDTAGDCWTLPFRAEGLAADTLQLDGESPTSATQGAADVTLCGPGHRAGDIITIDADLTIPMQTLSTSQVGYSITRDADTNPFYYLVSWVGGCDRFGPCDNRPDQFATYTFHVTHPDTLTARCPGTITEVSPTETQCDFTFEGGPTYSTFGVAAYPRWTERAKGTWGSVNVTLYDRDVTTIDGAIDPAYHAGFVSFMESTFGPFPFGNELRVLTAPTYWSGFEHPGNIVLDDQLNKVRSAYAKPVAHVLDHEMAHQWAGDQTTLADTYDFVWKESMAEYLAYVYEDMADAPSGVATASAWKSFSAGARYFPVPADKPELFDYYGDVYGPGPMILFRQLEVLSSREQVIAALQTVLGTPRALSVDQLIEALQTSTGLPLADYAAAWIHGSGAPDWPRIATTFTPGAQTSSLHVQLTNPAAGSAQRTCKFHVGLVGANAGETQLVEVDTFRNGIDQTLTVPTPAFTVASIALDPLRECLVFPATTAKPSPRVHPWLTARALERSF
ncbi:MAG TPA: M1 family aminopeptidase [Kofleriaceae bacterium]|nr:M1 family aminopeptidase [Kofleriaceae bacterium]